MRCPPAIFDEGDDGTWIDMIRHSPWLEVSEYQGDPLRGRAAGADAPEPLRVSAIGSIPIALPHATTNSPGEERSNA